MSTVEVILPGQAKPSRSARKKLKQNKAPKSKTVMRKAPALMPAMKPEKDELLAELRAERVTRDKGMARVLQSICAPRSYPPVRLGSGIGTYQTATANPKEVHRAQFHNDNTTAFLFRDPLRHLVTSVVSLINTEYRTTYGGNTQLSTQLDDLVIPRLGHFNGTQDHGDFLYSGRFSNAGKSYIPVSLNQKITFLNLTAGSTYIFTPIVYKPDGFHDTLPDVSVAPLATVDIFLNVYTTLPCVYVGFRVRVAAATAFLLGTLSLITPNVVNLNVWGHRAIPYLSTNLVSAEAIRFYGASITYTSTASINTMQGKIAAVQLPQDEDWRDFVSYDDVAAVKDCYTKNIIEGYYGFLKPTQVRDFDYIENWESYRGSLLNSWFDMASISDYIALSVLVENTEGKDGYFTVDAAVEYRTDDQWRETRPPDISAETVTRALELVPNIPQHHLNDSHLSDIGKFLANSLGSLWSGIKWAYPHVVKGLATGTKLASALGPFIV